jgi:undecaprenyl diphosphate synthase
LLNIFIYNIIESESSDHMNYEGLKIPNHVAIILDGNGRWATARNLSRSEGHRAGFDNLKTLAQYILSKNIKYLSVYAFSTENFKRSKEEVDFLMNLFIKFPFLKIGEYMRQNQEGQEYRTATSFIEEKIKKDKIDIEKMQEIMDSLEETENIGTDDAIFKWIDNLDLEEEEKEIQ